MHGIATAHLSGATHPNADDLDRAIMETLDDHRVEVVALAGYMKRLGPLVLSQYKGRMLNTHPALLPKYGGQGMYGDKVHKAVLAAGEKVSGATVHLVEGDYDTGPVLSSGRGTCPGGRGHAQKPYASVSKRLSANTTLTCSNGSRGARSSWKDSGPSRSPVPPCG